MDSPDSSTDNSPSSSILNVGVKKVTIEKKDDKVKQVGDWLLGATLGQGSFGKVKLATSVKTNEKVAVKIVDKATISNVEDVERVYRETFILTTLKHNHIIKLYEVLDTPKSIMLVMEYAGGGELFGYVSSKNRLDEIESCRLFHQIVSGVEYCHRAKIIHRDLKLENILLDKDGLVKIADFGLSNSIKFGQKMDTNCGTPSYTCPEQIMGKKYIGSAADIWSMGVILFAMICGFLPFEAPSVPQLFRKIRHRQFKTPDFVSKEAADLIDRMLTIDPDKRSTIAELRNHPWMLMEYTDLAEQIEQQKPVTSEMVSDARAACLSMADIVDEKDPSLPSPMTGKILTPHRGHSPPGRESPHPHHAHPHPHPPSFIGRPTMLGLGPGLGGVGMGSSLIHNTPAPTKTNKPTYRTSITASPSLRRDSIFDKLSQPKHKRDSITSTASIPATPSVPSSHTRKNDIPPTHPSPTSMDGAPPPHRRTPSQTHQTQAPTSFSPRYQPDTAPRDIRNGSRFPPIRSPSPDVDLPKRKGLEKGDAEDDTPITGTPPARRRLSVSSPPNVPPSKDSPPSLGVDTRLMTGNGTRTRASITVNTMATHDDPYMKTASPISLTSKTPRRNSDLPSYMCDTSSSQSRRTKEKIDL